MHNGAVTPTPCIIRAALPSDEPAWRQLWRGYCDFYEADVPDAVTNRTWKRILDPDAQVMCLVAEVEGKVQGFANCVVHENTWETQAVCYLEDLYVAPGAPPLRPLRPGRRLRAVRDPAAMSPAGPLRLRLFLLAACGLLPLALVAV